MAEGMSSVYNLSENLDKNMSLDESWKTKQFSGEVVIYIASKYELAYNFSANDATKTFLLPELQRMIDSHLDHCYVHYVHAFVNIREFSKDITRKKFQEVANNIFNDFSGLSLDLSNFTRLCTYLALLGVLAEKEDFKRGLELSHRYINKVAYKTLENKNLDPDVESIFK